MVDTGSSVVNKWTPTVWYGDNSHSLTGPVLIRVADVSRTMSSLCVGSFSYTYLSFLWLTC